jgi:hypothetical protein
LFLPRAVQVDGVLHILFDALERAWTSQKFWPKYEGLMKAVSKFLGARSYKERFLQKCMSHATAAERTAVIRFQGSHVDWRLP